MRAWVKSFPRCVPSLCTQVLSGSPLRMRRSSGHDFMKDLWRGGKRNRKPSWPTIPNAHSHDKKIIQNINIVCGDTRLQFQCSRGGKKTSSLKPAWAMEWNSSFQTPNSNKHLKNLRTCSWCLYGNLCLLVLFPVWVGMAYATVHKRGVKRQLTGAGSLLPPCRSRGNQTQVVGLGGRSLYPRSHLASLVLTF